ncbi:MAG: hypothetical protein QXH92_04385 [Candidatus Aenigmatarchaeota archaeon]
MKLTFGRVVDVIPALHIYKVQIASGKTAIFASDVTVTGNIYPSVKQHAIIPVGSLVLLVYDNKENKGYILGSVPDIIFDPNVYPQTYINIGSGTNYLQDPDRYLIENYSLHGARLAHAGRPFDATSYGEFALLSELGVGVYVDMLSAAIRADDITGLFVSYLDQYARLSGLNLGIESSVRHIDDGLFGGLVYGVNRYFLFLHELLGIGKRGIFRADIKNKPEVLINEPRYSRFVAKAEKQFSLARIEEYLGYLGNAKALFAILPKDLDKLEINKLDEERFHFRLATLQISHAGKLQFFGSKDVTIGMIYPLEAPKQVKLFPSLQGFKEEDIKKFPINISIPFKIKAEDDNDPDSDAIEKEDIPLVRVATSFEQISYNLNWYAVASFIENEAFYLPEVYENEFNLLDENAIVDFNELKEKQYLRTTESKELYIEERLEKEKFHKATAYLHFTEDGNFVLCDAYGVEIRSSKGALHISAPGEIWFHSGKQTTFMVGTNFILNALHHCEITTFYRDIRLASFRNIQIAAGLAKEERGGVLIESKASCPIFNFDEKTGENIKHSGILLISRSSPIVALSNNHIILSTCNKRESPLAVNEEWDVEGEFCGQGSIVLYSGKGIYQYSHLIKQDVTDKILNVFWQTERGGAVTTNSFSFRTSRFGTRFFERAASREDDDIGAKEVYYGRKYFELGLFRKAGFTFRTDLQYDVVEIDKRKSLADENRLKLKYKIYELRWHQLARLAGYNLEKWPERKLEVRQGLVTYPFPGNPNHKLYKIPQITLSKVDLGEVNRLDFKNPPKISIKSHALKEKYYIILDKEKLTTEESAPEEVKEEEGEE